MNWNARRKGQAAFGLVEILAIVAVLIVLAMVFLPAVAGCGPRPPRIKCVNNLKNIGLAFRIFSSANGDRFPAGVMVSNGAEISSIDILSVYKSMSAELSTPKILHCPADKKRQAAGSFANLTTASISYFVSLSADETLPQAFLAGDRNLQVDGKPAKPGLLTLTTNSAVVWTGEIHKGTGDILMADGSVQQVSAIRLQQATRDQGLGTNYLVVP